ncbi:hypothetical protein NQZ68_034493 [Dissostichus eleginoides]|uniref:Saxitoxin and tetrodotoxin-binding protein 2 n=1 Tax=Dissostichus eleginoides TaxID=100907 RepID=A0AAD9BPG1_DISEL|nr:hypothetical protein NQZ68_034493 [Dissostichus eleginoides]KAK1886149.1 Saxitoxin and tetrodotoxin-binding protein 2 [Dissostichus eleginoides]
MFAVNVITLLCLMSVSQAAPLGCEDLLRPLGQLGARHLEGRWVLVIGGMCNLLHEEAFKSRDSASIDFANASESSKMSFTRIFDFGGNCQYMHSNITLGESSFTYDQSNHTVRFLQTSCPDCLVMRFDNESQKPLRLYLFSRRRKVEQEKVKEFRAQVECLKFLPPVMMDPTKELCPEESDRHSAASED